MKVKAISLFEYETDSAGIYVNTTSRSTSAWQTDLSPFYLGPCSLYWGLSARIMENAYQYSKVYPAYDNRGEPTEAYFDWANKGWRSTRPQRYPMGKGVKPLYSWWDREAYSYVQARKKIYVPLYARAVVKTEGFKHLKRLYDTEDDSMTLYLKDYDAYRHEEKGMTLTEVLNNPNKKMGHAFVLMMLLTRDEALLQCDL